MTPTYIVGYDGSDAAGCALGFTRELARATGAGILAANVYAVPVPLVAPYPANLVPPLDPDLEAVQRKAAEEVLETVGPGARSRAVRGESVPRELHALADAEDAALIAVGATHRGPVGRLLPGSVGERTVHGAPCPVLVVPEGEGAQSIRSIGVAYDGHDESRRALRIAAELAERVGAALVLITAIDGTRGRADEAMLEQVAQQLRSPGLEVRTRILVAPAGPALVAETHDVDLLIAGSRGYGPLRSVMLGATTRHLVDHAPCPVLVVPRSATTAQFSADLRSAAAT